MYSLTRTVACSDAGPDKNMTLGALFTLMSDCELFQIESDKYLSDFLTSHGYVMYLASRQADIFRLPVYGETMKAVTSIYDLQAAFGFRNTYVYDAGGRVLTASYAMGLLVDIKTQRIVKAPEAFIKGYAYAPKLDMEYLPRRIELPGAPVRMTSFMVPRAYIDMNNHVNNVNYIVAAAEYLPDGAKLKRIRAEYKNGAKYGDPVDVCTYQNADRHIVELKRPGLTYAVVEFTL